MRAARWLWPVLLGIAAVLLFVAALLPQLSRIEIDTSMEGFLEPDDPVRLGYDAFREQFGREELILIAIRTSEVFRLEFLEKLPHAGETDLKRVLAVCSH